MKYHELAVQYHQVAQPLVRTVNVYESGTAPNASYEAKAKAKAESGIDSPENLEQVKREMRNFLESAASTNRQSVVVAERSYGVDHSTTAQQYIDLGILEHAIGNVQLGLKLTRYSVDLIDMIYGPGHPDAIRAIVSL